MPLTIQDVSLESYTPPSPGPADPGATSEPPPDMDRIRRELRRERDRQTRLWTD